MVRKISKEIEKQILAQYYTSTSKELGVKYGINPNTVKGIWQRNGYTGKAKFNPDIEEFTQLYTTMKVKDVATFYKKDRHTIHHFAKKIGIYQPAKPLLTSAQEQAIINEYYFTSAAKLAQQYNVSSSKISQIWSQAGLKGKTNRAYYLNEHYFDAIDSDDKAYWVGFIAADGCLYHPKDTRQDILSITLAARDESHLKKLQQSLNTDKPLNYGLYGENHDLPSVTLQVSSNQISRSLQKIGITYHKTYDVQWPQIPDKFIPAYIRGYFDGDGSISKNIEKNTLCRTAIMLVGFINNMTNFQQYLATQDIISTIVMDKRSYKYTKPGFCSLTLTNKLEKQKFLHLIYDNASVYLDRKYYLAQKFIDLCQENPTTWVITKTHAAQHSCETSGKIGEAPQSNG